MTVLIVGLGSMGKRRIRLLQRYDSQINIIGIDNDSVRCREVEEKYHIKSSSSIDDVLQEYDVECAFVATSPLSHAIIIHKCLEYKLDVFTEINLTDYLYDDNIRLAKKNGCTLFISSTFLYRQEIAYIRNRVSEENTPLTYIYHSGQYLPDWHPWENFQDFFVKDKRTNGCREIMAIEMPWLIEVFGNVESFEVRKDKTSSLDIDYPDRFIMTLCHSYGIIGQVIIDVLSREATRSLEVFNENCHIKWNGNPEGLFDFDRSTNEMKQVNLYKNTTRIEGYTNASIIEDAYYSEIQNFFNVRIHKETPMYSFEKDKIILAIIDQIESEG